MDEYAAVVKRFYAVYQPIGKKYKLRVSSRFQPGKKGFIRIYKGERRFREMIIRVEEEDDITCYERAIDALEYWKKNREEENEKYKMA